ncbi:MAG: glycoside hydrolase family 28 protein, partial [Alistipes sp.]|nr:glycoside hydrolase family 28 protein [Alistipes sp.]
IEDCTFGGYCKRGLYIKTNPDRGGFIRNIFFNNGSFGEVEDLFFLTSMYAGEGLDNHHYTAIHDIYVEDVTCQKARSAAIVLQGTEAEPLHNIHFTRVNVEEAAIGLSMDHTAEITFTDCHLGGRAGVPTTASAKDKVFEK